MPHSVTSYKKRGENVTFTENLEKAKAGDKRAYGMLCNLSADTLYGIAYLSLADKGDAEAAVKNAFDDGFRGINRINDENHLRAWLSRELTKHIVAKLKEYRAEEKSVKSDGSHEMDVFCRLGDLDRLVAALATGFGYNVKEITVITGLKEETVERKIRESDKKLGKDKQITEDFLRNVKAPDSLTTKAPAVTDLTVEIDKTDDDGLIGEMERIAAIAEAEEKGISPEAPAEGNPKLIRFEPVKFSEEAPAPSPEKEEKEEEHKPSISLAPKAETEPVTAAPAAEEKPVVEKTAAPTAEEPVKEETVKEEPVAQKPAFTPAPGAEEPVQTAEAEKQETKAEKEPEQPAVQKPAEPPREIDARTFINVITSQKIKGRDFLKLMGNTRISNEVYREIEQNPNLTKERLVELLENSALTSADYYKVLTAVKQRNELIAKKEQANVLFDINSKKEEKNEPSPTDTRAFAAPVKEEEAKTERPQKVEPTNFDFGKKPEKEKLSFDFPKRNEPEIKPFMPIQDVEPDDEDDEDLDLDDGPVNPIKIPSPKAPAPKAPEAKEDEPEAQQPVREKYKGKEFFIDDDVYYPGVNNGKLIFAAVCAVLLVAGSFGIRYMMTGSLLPGAEKEPTVVVESLPETYASDDDIYKAISLTENAVTNRTSDYYRADAKGYSEAVTKDFCETDDKIYIADENAVVVYSLDAEKPEELYRVETEAFNGEFLGFTAWGDKLCMLYNGTYDYPISYTVTSSDEEGNPVTANYEAVISRDCVYADFYENGEYSKTYTQDGRYSAVKTTDEAFSLATTVNTADGAVSGVPETYLPSYQLDEKDRVYVDYSGITVPDGIGYNGFTVIGTVSGEDARAVAVMGGSQSFTEFGEGTCRVIISDKNKTYEENFRFVGSNLTLDSTRTYVGECFGPQFVGEKAAVTYQPSDNSINVITENGATNFVMGAGETLSGAAFEGDQVHIVTQMAEGTMLYCVNLNDMQNPAEAKPDAIYSEKLKDYGTDELLGLSVEADESGNRTGLRLSVYGYDGKLTEKRYATITLDEQTSTEYLRYLSADAESSNLRIAEDNGFIAVSTVYFDGISEIERILCFKDDGSALTETTDLLLFDIQSDYRFLTFCDGMLFVITDSRIITIDPENGKAQGYFSSDEQEAVTEAAPETEESSEESTIE